MSNKLAVYIGRFQPFHNGHLSTILDGFKHAERMLILVGSSNLSLSAKNPWNFQDRRRMIQSSLDAEGIHRDTYKILELFDYSYNDNQWIEEVQHIVDENLDSLDEEIILLGANKDDSTYYLNLFPQWKFHETPLLDINLNATAVREMVFENKLSFIKSVVPNSVYLEIQSHLSNGWLADQIEEYKYVKEYKKSWANSPFPPTFMGVDAVVVQSGHVLLVKRGKNPGRGLYALPGGFVDQNEYLVDAAIRELKEETNIKLQEQVLKRCVSHHEIFDKPDRSLRGRVFSVAYLIRLDDSQPLPKIRGGDDAAEAEWVPFSKVRMNQDQFFEDHFAILEYMLQRA